MVQGSRLLKTTRMFAHQPAGAPRTRRKPSGAVGMPNCSPTAPLASGSTYPPSSMNPGL
ncbi:hypothetical protein FGIG_05441 [Fasciola gigantica]|uniref:Uncharacterized protein n=1 Tax=Fasciola gigantica TaxID=46835 RepID=A0A504YH79_FASGI|nr:hypothetical protein FGIG_05441 [Fasciola gigantica]